MIQNMNITFFVYGLDSGGLENYLLRFLQEKHAQFNNIYIYCKSGKDGQLRDQFLAIPNVVIVKSKIGHFDYLGLKKIYNFLKLHNISAVCDFTGNFSGLILMTAAKAGISKRVVFYRSSTDRFKKDILRQSYNTIMNMMVNRFATDILANSKTAMNNYFRGIWLDSPKFEVIYNGINAEKFLKNTGSLRSELGIPEDAYVIGHTGRFNPAKNHETIIAVAEILVERHKDIYFIMCGNGVKKNLYNLLSKKELTNRILVFENRQDIPQFLSTMDCYFFPSITEGQPNALIEAMLIGLPYIASNIEPIKETVFNNKNLYNPYDIDSFISALEALYNARMSRVNDLQCQVIEKFNSEKLFNRFYNRLKI